MVVWQGAAYLSLEINSFLPSFQATTGLSLVVKILLHTHKNRQTVSVVHNTVKWSRLCLGFVFGSV